MTISITSQFSVFGSLQELPDDIQNMMEQAVAVRKKSICTLFKKGSPVAEWTNFFSSAYPSGLCAERVAIFKPGLFILRQKLKMAITAASDSIKQ
jgi:cytidine deaminase